MRRIYLFALVILCMVVSGSPASFALSQSDTGQLILNAVVPPIRVIYIDSQGNILKVAGNTSDNIEPEVIKDRKLTAMTPNILSQYEQIIKDNGGLLQPGLAYRPHASSILTRFIKTSVLSLPITKF